MGVYLLFFFCKEAYSSDGRNEAFLNFKSIEPMASQNDFLF